MATNTNPSVEPKIYLAENFYSIQGEGISSGIPAYFIRLSGCNFMCGGRDGSLMKAGKATWYCDTEAVWRKGKQTHMDELITDWQKQGILEWVLSGRVRLVWTGGEPTLPAHQPHIVACMEYLDRLAEEGKISKNNTFNEIETNGSIFIEQGLFNRLDQINCSPKLINSGVKEIMRIQPSAVKRIMSHHNYQFKFVVSTEEDILEVIRDFVKPFDIPATRIVLMPGLDCQANFHERTRFVLEMAKKYGFLGLTRLHVSAWDKTVGV